MIADLPHINKNIKQTTTVHLKKGETVTSTDQLDSIWIVKSGFVKRFEIISTGALRVQGFYAKGDIFPLTFVFKIVLNRSIYFGPEVYHYVAMCNTTLERIKGDALLSTLDKEPLAYKDLLSVAGNRFVSNIHLLENHGLPHFHKRLAHLLSFYAQHYGTNSSKGTVISVPLTQQDIADIMSVTRETVSAGMRELKKLRLISGTRAITVQNIPELEFFAFK